MPLIAAATRSQPQNGISLKSYPAAGARVTRGIWSAVTRIQQPELDPTVGRSHLQLVSSRRNSSQP